MDLRAPARGVLWIVDPAHDRVLVRELDRSRGREELSREELGHILETSTEGLLAGAELLDRYRDIMVVTSPPPFLQRLLNPPLARLERRRRARARAR